MGIAIDSNDIEQILSKVETSSKTWGKDKNGAYEAIHQVRMLLRQQVAKAVVKSRLKPSLNGMKASGLSGNLESFKEAFLKSKNKV